MEVVTAESNIKEPVSDVHYDIPTTFPIALLAALKYEAFRVH